MGALGQFPLYCEAPRVGEVLSCSLVLMTEFPQSQQPELAEEKRVQKQSPKAKLAAGFPQLLSGEPGIRASLPSPSWPKSTSRRTRDRTLQPGRCPLGLSHLHVSPHSLPGSLFQSLSVASLHANRVHWPGLMACRRGLGHRLQLLLGLPDVMELLELLHHAVFEVWV